MANIFTIFLVVAALVSTASASTSCVACALVLTLLEQDGTSGPAPGAADPDTTCTSLGLCTGECLLFNGTWPVKSPHFPTDGKVVDQRLRVRRLRHAFLPWSHVQVPESARGHGVPTPVLKFLFEFKAVAEAFEALHGRNMDFYGIWTSLSRMLLRHNEEVAAVAPHVPVCQDIFNLTCVIPRVFDDHLPLLDGDDDYFSADLYQLRGASWRGKDCNDSASSVYPGRRAVDGDAIRDSNCNGIYGANATGTFEDLFCSGANAPMGIAVLGDSASAHFHLPPQYVNAANFTLDHVVELAANEADWPQCSWSTGFRSTLECPAALAPMGSVYQRMLQRNRCNHRDLQNIAVNGARTTSMAPPGIIEGLARDPSTDVPALVFFALIGNDVCNGHPGTSSMTPPAVFKKAVLESLAYLETTLPPSSHVAFMPLADGRVLYDTMHARTHPLGVTYSVLYDYLACNDCSPCRGWMTTNATMRNITSEWAANLTSVYTDIMESHSFDSFDMHLLSIDWWVLLDTYKREGGQPWQLIEPVDGFHPDQTGQQLLAEAVWEDLAANTTWIQEVNPHNWEIAQMFGAQGGY